MIMPVPGNIPWEGCTLLTTNPNLWLRETNSVLKDSTRLISRWVQKNAALSRCFQKLSLWLARFPSPSLLTLKWYVRYERFEKIGKYIHYYTLVQLASISIRHYKTSKPCFTTFEEAKCPEIPKRLACCHHQGPIGVDQGSPSVHLMAKFLCFHIIEGVNKGNVGKWLIKGGEPFFLTPQPFFLTPNLFF